MFEARSLNDVFMGRDVLAENDTEGHFGARVSLTGTFAKKGCCAVTIERSLLVNYVQIGDLPIDTRPHNAT